MFNISKNMKNNITRILAIVLLSTFIVTLPQSAYAASNTIKLYDINKDGKTNFSDLMLIMQQIYMNRNSTPSKEVISVELNKTSLEIEKGNKEKLEAKITPENLSDQKLTWKSENEEIATVDDTGTVEAIEEGTTQITVQTENGKSASCTIMVINTEMKLNETNIELNVGEIKEIYVENMKDEPLIWSSSDPSIVSIGQTKSEENVSVEFSENSIVTINRGIEITALKEGTAEIEVKTSYNKTAKCTITVKNTIFEEPTPDTPEQPPEEEPKPEIIEVTEIKLDKTELELTVGNTEKLEATITPEEATDKTITWSSSDTNIAEISEDGTITAKAQGNVTITATTSNNKQATCTITIKEAETTPPEQDTPSTPPEETQPTPSTPPQEGPSVDEPVEATRITLNETKIELITGNTTKLQATISPDYAINKTVTWSSNNTDVATVTEDGIVKAISKGNATITASTSNGKTATCYVVVTNPIVEVEYISLSRTSLELKKDYSLRLEATITPGNATNRSITWTSEDTKIATVNSEGTVKAISKGTTTITATTTNGKTATCTVTVIEPQTAPLVPDNPVISETGITLNETKIEVRCKETIKLQATVLPENATVKTVTWTSANEDIAMVYEDGTVLGLSTGSTDITARTSNGKTATCHVVVTDPIIEVSYVTLNKSTLNLTPGKTETLQATITPGNATNKTLTWTSSNTAVATVNENGIVKAISKGTTTITVKASTGDAGKCTVIVKEEEPEVTKITLNKTNLKLEKGKSEKLIATIEPESAKNQELTWTSSNSAVAKVDSSGTVTAVSKGEIIITVRTKNGTSVSCFVTVVDPNEEPEKPPVVDVTGVYLNKSSLELLVGKKEQITAIILPTNATNREVKWTTSNASVATVSSDGTITAISVGKATITVTSKANGDSAQCFVTVTDGTIKATNITLNTTNIKLEKGETQKLTATITPTNTTDKTIKWTSSNTNIAMVGTDGTITAKAKGTANITATTSNGLSAVCYVEVTETQTQPQPQPGTVIDGQTVNLPAGDKLYFLDTVYREDGKKDGTGISNDCIIIESNGEYAMIDTGKLEVNYRIKNYLKELGITELKWVLITHCHTDHIGGVKNAKTNIYEQVKVDTLYIKDRSDSPDYKTVYNNTVKVAKDHNTKVVDPNTISNKQIKVGNITFKLFNTQDRLGKKVLDSTEENVNSIVAAATISGKRVYLAADLGRNSTEGHKIVTEITTQVMDYFGGQRINLYKAAHHGYDNVHKGLSPDLLTKQLKNPYNVVVTSYKNDSRGTIVTNYINKTAKAGYYTASGTVIANISKDGELTFKQLDNYYTYALPS